MHELDQKRVEIKDLTRINLIAKTIEENLKRETNYNMNGFNCYDSNCINQKIQQTIETIVLIRDSNCRELFSLNQCLFKLI
jgi:hypothetical protein